MNKGQRFDFGPTGSGDKPRCGLCGKTGELTRTPCCGNWICDDADQYVPFSYGRNSCFTNHYKYTVCAAHHQEGHGGRWQECAKCREVMPLELYAHYGTNEYNFEKLENPPKFEPTHCAGCGAVIRLAEGGFMMQGDKFRCEACSSKESGALASQSAALRANSSPQSGGMEQAPVRVTGRRGQYPAATLAYYGPNNQLATKLAVAILRTADDEDGPLHRWITQAGDIRNDAEIAKEMESFLQQHGVKQRIATERIIGCAHEEGKDYPMGGECPHCPYWHNRNRFTHELLTQPARVSAKVGRNEPCPCGSGEKYKKCCGQ